MKKWTKKLVWLLVFALLISTCLLSFTACDEDDDDDDDDGAKTVEKLNGKTAAELYVEALTQMGEAFNYEMDGEMVFDMQMAGQGMTASMRMEEDIVYKMNGTNLYMKMSGESTGVEAGSNLMEVWYVNGVCYVHTDVSDEDPVKGKVTMSLDDFMGEFGEEGSSTMIELDASYLEGAKFKKDGNDYYVEITITGDEVADIVRGAMEDQGMGADMEFDNLVYKLFFDADGTMTGGEATFTMAATAEGMTISASVTMEFEYKYNSVGTINPPADANSYIDMTGRI